MIPAQEHPLPRRPPPQRRLVAPNTVAGNYWHELPDGRIQCDLCPRLCRLREGQRGSCFVRARRDGQIVLTSYGRSSGFCIDPVEKKPLNHFLPGTPVLSFGTAGCNLACKFCQNWSISKSREIETLAAPAYPETIAQAAQQTKCRSVAFTYNDPVIFLEYAADTAAACRQAGIRTVAVTAGYIQPAARPEFFHYIDAANVDLKAFDEGFYHKITGSHLQPVLDTLLWLRHESQVWLEITTLLIPGHNDDPQQLHAMSRWIASELGPDVPLHFTAFHPDHRMRDVAATPAATLLRARRIAQEQGLRYVYTGNIHHADSASTYCHQCGAQVIRRDCYELLHWGLDARGCCTACGTPCAGVFESTPGSWGARYAAVDMHAFAQRAGQPSRTIPAAAIPPAQPAASADPLTRPPAVPQAPMVS